MLEAAHHLCTSARSCSMCVRVSLIQSTIVHTSNISSISLSSAAHRWHDDAWESACVGFSTQTMFDIWSISICRWHRTQYQWTRLHRNSARAHSMWIENKNYERRKNKDNKRVDRLTIFLLQCIMFKNSHSLDIHEFEHSNVINCSQFVSLYVHTSLFRNCLRPPVQCTLLLSSSHASHGDIVVWLSSGVRPQFGVLVFVIFRRFSQFLLVLRPIEMAIDAFVKSTFFYFYSFHSVNIW